MVRLEVNEKTKININRDDSPRKFKITYGGWYQRTTLHLSEIYDLFAFGKSNLNLPKDKLFHLYNRLELEKVTREAGYFEYVKAITKKGIEIRYYEDGLYILEIHSNDIEKAKKTLEDYFDKTLNPAIAFIFSLGAPTPKILANIKTVHPTVISLFQDNPENLEIDPENFGNIYSKISSDDIVVYKTPQYIFMASSPKNNRSTITDLVEMQIFFREFKDQLEKYLTIHRNIWEEIASIKERKEIRGNEIEDVRNKLDNYQKTISLISNRINQMSSYISTRSSIAENLEIDEHLRNLFQFKFEVLTDTLEYIKEIWKMTSDYLSSAIQNIVEIKNQAASRGIQSLQIITSIGVISGIIGYVSKNELSKITAVGIFYFGLIIAVALLMNYIVAKSYKNKKYSLKFGERAKDI
jgi:hypothetical protein